MVFLFIGLSCRENVLVLFLTAYVLMTKKREIEE